MSSVRSRLIASTPAGLRSVRHHCGRVCSHCQRRKPVQSRAANQCDCALQTSAICGGGDHVRKRPGDLPHGVERFAHLRAVASCRRAQRRHEQTLFTAERLRSKRGRPVDNVLQHHSWTAPLTEWCASQAASRFRRTRGGVVNRASRAVGRGSFGRYRRAARRATCSRPSVRPVG
jgi:hypothetical protein